MLVKADTTSVITYVKLIDSTAGTPETAYTITDLDLTFVRDQAAASKTDATALGGVTSAFSANKAIEVDSTNAPGLYRVDWPDSAFSTGVKRVQLVVNGSGLDPAVMEAELITVDLWDTVRAGLTALPNAAADAAGGLAISDAGGLDLDSKLANTNEVTAARMAALTDWINGGRLDLLFDAILDDTSASGVVLADNAITSAKYDESTAFAVTSADTGATQIARVGADSDTLETLSDQMDAIGTSGASLTAIPWNAAWDAEVQSEVEDALVANNLDHLAKTATAAADMTTEVADNTILSRVLSNGDTSAFVPSTDGLQPFRDAVADLVHDEIVTGHTTANSLGWFVHELWKMLNNRMEIDVDNGVCNLYDNDGTTVLKAWPLKDKDGNAITLPAGAMAERQVRTT